MREHTNWLNPKTESLEFLYSILMDSTHKFTCLASLLLLLGTQCVHAFSHPECEANDGDADSGLSLLQTGVKPIQGPTAGTARKLLPPHLYKLGLKLLKREVVLDAIVADTRLETYPHAGVNVTFRITTGDRVDGVDQYGLNSLGNSSKGGGMINMLDIGGNLGRVSITAFKQLPRKMRIVVAEPVPTTYFLLRWNLWLNKVPELTLSEFQSSPKRPGVLALHSGIASKDGQTVGMCYTPPWTLGSRICDCKVEEPRVPKKWMKQCLPMVGHTMHYFLRLFGDANIGLLKLDCEGCEHEAVPQLKKHLQTSGQQIMRFAGELHEQRNNIEDLACKFEGGRWFEHVCFIEAQPKGWFKTVPLSERCKKGSGRESCVRQSILDAEEPPTSNFFEQVGLHSANP